MSKVAAPQRPMWIAIAIASLIGVLAVTASVEASARGLSCGDLFSASRARPVKLVPVGTDGFVNRDGRKIYARVDGNPDAQDTIVVLSGLGRNSSTWTPFMPEVEGDLRVIRIDMWGQGRTLHENGLTDSVEMSDIIKDIDAVVDSFGTVGRIFVVGHSFGGGVAMAMVKESRIPIEEVFLLAPFVPRLEEQQFGPVGQMYQNARMAGAATIGLGTYDTLFNMTMRPFMYLTHSLAEMQPKAPIETEAIVQLTIAVRTLDVDEILKNTGTRVNMIIAGLDFLVPQAAHLKLWETIPPEFRGLLVNMPTGSHYIPERHLEGPLAGRLIREYILGRLDVPAGSVGEADLGTSVVKFGQRRISFAKPLGADLERRH